MSFCSSAWLAIKEWTTDCCFCMGGCCSASWNWLNEAFLDSMDWCRNNCCCCCPPDSDDNEDVEPRSPSPPPSPARRARKSVNRRNIKRVQYKQPPVIVHTCDCSKQQQQQQQSRLQQQHPTMGQQPSSSSSPPPQVQLQQSPPQAKSIPTPIPQQVQLAPIEAQTQQQQQQQQSQQIPSIRPPSPTMPPILLPAANLGPNPSIGPNLKSVSSGPMRPHPSIMPTNKPQQLDPSMAQKMTSRAAKSRVEPPRIDFIETGSIFGDRKRGIDQNMLLLENGRFKSPGQSKILTGPGGRSIRQSFQTGFPSFKSIESRSSLAEAHNPNKPKRSIESMKQSSMPRGSQEKMNLEAFKSTTSKISQRKFKSRASMKSLKSSGSLGSQPTRDQESDPDEKETSANK